MSELEKVARRFLRMNMLAQIFLADIARAEMTPIDSIEVLREGLAGDRYARGIGSFSKGLKDGRAITLIAGETIDFLKAEHGVDWGNGEHRRNLVTRGVDLDSLVHVRFRIGGAVLRGNRRCPPCGYLSKLTGADAKALLHRRGGLRADVIEPGRIAVGDAIERI